MDHEAGPVIGLDGWIPLGFDWDGPAPEVDWCHLGGMRFTEPFFENTMRRAMEQPARVLFRQKTTVDMLEERARNHPGIPPTGFVFHMSRCGSTLISQMLAASEENVVISEGWPIDAAISADLRHPEITAEERTRWLRGVVHALGQPRLGTERRYFVKFDATHTIDLPLVRRAFPQVPWIFLYRDPVEVLVSQLRRRAAWTMPGIVRVRGVGLTAAAFAEPGEYVADLLARICESALEAGSEGGSMFVNYRELPGAVYGRLASHWGCPWYEGELQRMHVAAIRDAKQPEHVFSADSDRKQSEAGERVREICSRKLGHLYRRLEGRASVTAR